MTRTNPRKARPFIKTTTLRMGRDVTRPVTERMYNELAAAIIEAVFFVAAEAPDSFSHIRREPASKKTDVEVHQALHTLRLFASNHLRTEKMLRGRLESLMREKAVVERELCELRPLLYRAGKRYLEELGKQTNDKTKTEDPSPAAGTTTT